MQHARIYYSLRKTARKHKLQSKQEIGDKRWIDRKGHIRKRAGESIITFL